MSIFLSLDQQSLDKFNKNAKSTGIAMIVIGIIGIVFPSLISFTLNFFIGSIFLSSAFILAFSAYACRTQTLMMWFKPFILFVLSLIIFFHPSVVLSTLGILLALYFFIDGFASAVLSVEIRPAKGWMFMLINGILSVLLGGIVIAGWPLSSVWLVGLFVGISFLLDGIALIAIAGNVRAS